jgi:CBS domain containing-hemolysin-like protein
MAFVSINRAMVADKARQGDKKAKILEKLLKNPDNVISAIVIGNNLVNVFASILAGSVVTRIFGNIGIGIATIIMFFLVIVFCESAPKSLGIKNEKFALRVARPIYVITKLFHPLVIMLNYISKGLISLVGHDNNRDTAVTEDEIMAMMRLGEEEGTIEKDEREMVNDVFEFDETVADEVDMPKHKIIFIHKNETVEKLIEKTIITGYSRFPVYNKNYDDVIGMVHVKDTLILKDKSIPVSKIMRPILKIHAEMKADDVLRKMKQNNTHLALLQDKNDKTIGLVSMEDLIEEIFGEITDEHDI